MDKNKPKSDKIVTEIITVAFAISRFEEAVRAHETKDLQPVYKELRIVKEYDDAKKHLISSIDALYRS